MDESGPAQVGASAVEPEPDECPACALAADRVRNLEAALEHCRIIGAAIGILMERHRMTVQDAFDSLRLTSNLANRKLHDLAAELVLTGRLPEPPSG